MLAATVVLSLLLPTSAFVLPGAPPHAACTARPRAHSPLLSLQDDLSARMRAALKAGDKQTLSTLRLVVSALTTKCKESGVETLPDKDALSVLAKLAKMRAESIEMFTKGGRLEAAAKEQAELDLLSEYLPKMASEEVVRGWIADAIAEACPDGPDKSKMGAVMGKLMGKHKGEFDGKQASKWVAEALR